MARLGKQTSRDRPRESPRKRNMPHGRQPKLRVQQLKCLRQFLSNGADSLIVTLMETRRAPGGRFELLAPIRPQEEPLSALAFHNRSAPRFRAVIGNEAAAIGHAR